jgi:adenosylcobinamide-GDP ribazoletransferase
LNKFAALQMLLAGDAWDALLLVPVWGRTMLVLLLVTTPYVRPGGLGFPYADELPRLNGGLLVALIAIATVALLGWVGGLLLIVLGIGFLGLRHAWMMRLNGITGDALGTTCEVMEALALLTLALLLTGK